MPIFPGIGASLPTVSAAAPAFVAAVAGTGSGTLNPATALAPGAPAGIADLDILILQVALKSSIPGMTVTDPAGWNQRFNDVSSATVSVRQFIYTRQYVGAFAMPTIPWDPGLGALPAARARIYAVRGADTTLDSTSLVGTSGGTVNNIAIPAITTVANNTLAIALYAINNLFLSNDSTGETGGDYTQPIPAFMIPGGSAGNCGLHIQSATKAAPGSLSGGVVTFTGGTPTSVCRVMAFQPG